MKKRFIPLVFGVTLLTVLALAALAWGKPSGPTATAGFTDLPLRNCEGLYCGVLAKLPIGTQVRILLDDREGWAFVEVPSLNKTGWINTHNIF